MARSEQDKMGREELLKIIDQAAREGWEELDLSDKGISELPPEIGHLTNLTQLDLGDNRLSELLPEIGQLTNLTWLDLGGNQLSELPPEITQLTNLIEFDLNGNRLSELTPEIDHLTNLTRLDLGGNRLSELTPEIGHLTNLTQLDLGGNQLSELPEWLGQLSNLQELNLSGIQLSELPEVVGQLTNLQTLDLSRNQLSELPEEIGHLTNLTQLDLSHIQLSELPELIGHLTNLTQLNLGRNQLSELPQEIGHLTKLTQLGLSGNQLRELPPEIGQLTNLTRLDLGNNQLSELPPEIGHLTNLTELDLGGNQLSKLPPEIVRLTNLTKLDLSGNPLRELPPEIGHLTNLRELNLGGNRLSELPSEIGHLTNLTQLNLYSNQLSELPPEIVRLTNLQKLNLGGNRLSELPSEIGHLTNLTQLNLYSNQLGELRPEIIQLTNLTQLDLGGNQLSELPPEIVRLTNLQKLNLGSNRLSELPSEIGHLTNLTQLNLYSNQLSELPPEIGHLTDLTQLNLNDNQLTELPPEIGHLTNLTELYLGGNQLNELPPEIVQLTNLQRLYLSGNQLTELPPEIVQLTNLQRLSLSHFQLTELPPEIVQLTNLQELSLSSNQLTELPPEIVRLTNLQELDLFSNQLTELPPEIVRLTNLQKLTLHGNQLSELSPEIGQLTNLTQLYLGDNRLTELPSEIGQLTNLTELYLHGNQLTELSPEIGQLTNLQKLTLHGNQLSELPPEIGQLTNLQGLDLSGNLLTSLPISLVQLEKLRTLNLDDNPLNPALQSTYEAGLDELRAYLLSLEDAEPLYEAKLVLVGEGGVGKTTLLKALTGQEPREGESTTHGVEIDVQALHLFHPEKEEVQIQFNAWDFGGQEVYRVTHQFFFSRRSIYLLVWEPRKGVQQCQVEDWLKLIRLRVGDNARVIIVSTHCQTGERIARIDKPVFMRDYGSMIVGFLEVDSLVDDPETGEKIGMGELKTMIAEAAKDLEHVGMLFNRDWRKARDELLAITEPRIAYREFAAVCQHHGLNAIATKTLANLMDDLGYIVYYSDDEHLKDDVVLQPEWLTKAIGFVLEDRTTNEMDGILPDSRLKEVWWDHHFKDQPRYTPALYPFFLRLMEKYDVSYRLEEGNASLVAQHVPQVRPDLPWLPEEEPTPDRRRIAMVCVMDEAPPGLVPWMIVRTHDYAYEQRGADGKRHHLHWEKGMFLRNQSHGEAMLELRGREFHVYAEAVWPEFFMNIVRKTLSTLITDNWPGMKDRYYFAVPCREKQNGAVCDGRFDIDALRQFLEEGDETYRCQSCRTRQDIVELLFGFEEEDSREQLGRIESKLDRGFEELMKEIEGLESRLANYVMTILQAIASESKAGPRLFTIVPADGNWKWLVAKRYRLYLWCEAEGCQHPVIEEDKGWYEIEATREWVKRVTPYANFVAGVLRTILPMVAPAVNAYFGPKTIDTLGWKDRLDLMKTASGELLRDIEISDPSALQEGVLTEAERSGVLALHALLREKDPNQERLGLKRVPTYTGDYLWLCQRHYEQSQPKIPEKIE